MALFEVSPDGLLTHAPEQFERLKIYERTDLQRLIRDEISVIDPDLLVVSEEYGNWEDARRRIDLLAVDRIGRLIVIELKRTDDGGHMELQAIRYAAMVSTMAFKDVLEAFEAHRLRHPGPDGTDRPEDELRGWLDQTDLEEEPEISSEVGVILISADFGIEITTAVMWLNKFEGMDIRCVRLQPYSIDGKVLLDIQQVLPLPEAADYQVKVRRKEAAIGRARTDGRDFTKYSIVRGDSVGPEQNKRHAVLEMVGALHERGASLRAIKALLPPARMMVLPGALNDGEEIAALMLQLYPKAEPRRWFVDDAFSEGDETYIVTKMWGRNTEPILTKLSEAFPESRVSFRRHAEPEQ